ncbi:MAG: glycosyl hydrolase [Akkermansiaceae bacterium]
MKTDIYSKIVFPRRHFLKSLTLAGAVCLSGALSVMAADSEEYSEKKGFCGGNVKGHEEMNVAWFYTWFEGGDRNAKIEFVPMVKGKAKLGDNVFNQIRKKQNVKYLLGYNEPERAKQGNISVEEGLKAWPKLVKLAEEKGVPLGSPAVSSDKGGLAWLDKFMKGAKKEKLKIDFLAVHWYGGTDVDQFEKYLDNLYDKYRLPIWVTEFNGWSGTEREMEEFAIKSFKMLEKHRKVERYAYFSKKKGTAGSLWNADGTLSKIGLAYKEL